MLAEVARRIGAEQRFSVVYSPWLDGSIERLNRDLQHVLKVLCLEAKVSTREWLYSLPVVQASLNHSHQYARSAA